MPNFIFGLIVGLFAGAIIAWIFCSLLCAHQWQEWMMDEALRKWEGKTE